MSNTTNCASSVEDKALLITTSLTSFASKKTYLRWEGKTFNSTLSFSVRVSYFISLKAYFLKGISFNLSRSSKQALRSFSSSFERHSMAFIRAFSSCECMVNCCIARFAFCSIASTLKHVFGVTRMFHCFKKVKGQFLVLYTYLQIVIPHTNNTFSCEQKWST